MAPWVQWIPLTDVSLRDACHTLNMAYQGYIVPVSFDPQSLVRRIQAEDIDLFSSRLLLVEQQPAGIMLIARRGRLSRIAALGIVPRCRGAGYGRQAVALAIAEARSRDDGRQVLEVIETNRAAISIYTRAGFVPRRRLVGYTHDPVHFEGGVVSCPAEEILPLLVSAYLDNPSWQSSPLCFAYATHPVEGVRTSDGPQLPLSTDRARRRDCWLSPLRPQNSSRALAAASCGAYWAGFRTNSGQSPRISPRPRCPVS